MLEPSLLAVGQGPGDVLFAGLAIADEPQGGFNSILPDSEESLPGTLREVARRGNNIMGDVDHTNNNVWVVWFMQGYSNWVRVDSDWPSAPFRLDWRRTPLP